jgi:hypothetical protein
VAAHGLFYARGLAQLAGPQPGEDPAGFGVEAAGAPSSGQGGSQRGPAKRGCPGWGGGQPQGGVGPAGGSVGKVARNAGSSDRSF